MAQELTRLPHLTKRVDAIEYLMTRAARDFPHIEDIDRFYVGLVPEGNRQVWALFVDNAQ
jgi:hypothetical protein